MCDTCDILRKKRDSVISLIGIELGTWNKDESMAVEDRRSRRRVYVEDMTCPSFMMCRSHIAEK